MFSVKIRGHIMVAHSLPHAFFGPAQNMHGATFVTDAEFFSEKLDAHNVVIDIGKAHEILDGVLAELNYKNLDEHPDMQGDLTTTEYLAKYIHDKVKEQSKEFFEGKIRLTLGETHVAWASYEG